MTEGAFSRRRTAPCIGTVHVVVAVFNRRHYTRTCLSLLRRQTYAPVRVWVVDDGSSDGTSAMIARDFPDVRMLQGTGLLYWTGSMRAGIETVLQECDDSDWVFVLNNDLLFDEHIIDTLASASARHPGALIHACNTFNDAPDLIGFGGVQVNWWTAGVRWIHRGRSLADFHEGHLESTDLVWGRGLLIPVSVLREIGNYDPRYQQNGDSEFGRRAAKAGHALYVCYDAVTQLYHEGENSALLERTRYRLNDIRRYFWGVHSGARLHTIALDARLMTTSTTQAVSYGLCSFLRFLNNFLWRLR